VAADDDVRLGGVTLPRDTKDRLFGLLRDFDNRDRSVVQRRDEWSRLGHVLQRNAAELTRFLDGAAGGAVLADLSIVSEAERLVFNFAAAVAARVDHYRRSTKRETDAFKRAYEAVISPLRESDEHVLVVTLRHYVTHVGLSPLSTVEFAIPEGRAAGIYLRRDALERCDEAQKPRAREVFARMDPHIALRPLIERYRMLATEQDEAVQALFDEHYADELTTDAEAWAKVQEAWRDAGFGAWLGA